MSQYLDKHMNEIQMRLEKMEKRALAPVFSFFSAEQDLTQKSFFGGLGSITNINPYPRCEACGEYLTTLLQIDLDELDKRLKDLCVPAGLLFQFFICNNLHCPSIDGDCEFAQPFRGGKVLRTILKSEVDMPLIHDVREQKKRYISHWASLPDYPADVVLETIGVANDPEEVLLARPDYDFDYQGPLPVLWTDKIGGWGLHDQDPDPPFCESCKTSMLFFGQIVSGLNVEIVHVRTNGFIWNCPQCWKFGFNYE